MEEEIDLRASIEILLRYWKWIVGLALAAAIAAFVVSSLLPPTYEASAVILVSEPRYQMRFDSRLATTQDWKSAYKTFPILATSDDVLQGVVDAYVPSPEAAIDDWQYAVLSEMVDASTGSDPSLLLLTVLSRSAQDAAAIADLWADALVRVGNDVYGGGPQDVAFFEEQVEQAAQALDTADAALIEFEARNQTNIVTTQLDSYLQAQADYLDAQRTISSITQDIQGLRDQLPEQSGNQSVSLADDLTALLLLIKAFNAQPETPIELQVESSGPLSNKTLAEQIAFLDGLAERLQAKSAEMDARLVELEPEILALQQGLQEMTVEYDRLARTQELARETYLTLARKLDEARIAAQEENGTFQVASYASVPTTPVAPRRLRNTVMAGVLGLMLGIIGAFAVEFWRQNALQVQGGEE